MRAFSRLAALLLLAAVTLAAACSGPAPPATFTPTAAPGAGGSAPDARGDSSPPAAPQIGGEFLGAEEAIIAAYEKASPGVVQVRTRVSVLTPFGPEQAEGAGSGWVFDRQGHLITNWHVVANADAVEVQLADGRALPAQIVGTDAFNDLAVLRVDAASEQLHPLELGESDALRVGQLALAIGSPFGQFQQTLTTGVVSALDRVIETDVPGFGQRTIGGVIQTDAAINKGNSGGPLLDSQGRVIGVNTQIASPTGGSVGIGFAVSVDTVKRVVPELVANGRYAHPALGIEMFPVPVSPLLARLAELSVDRGVLVVRVVPGGPADRAGIQGATGVREVRGVRIPVGGDVILSVDGQPVLTLSDLTLYLEENKRPGDRAAVTVARNGQELEIEVTLGELPA